MSRQVIKILIWALKRRLVLRPHDTVLYAEMLQWQKDEADCEKHEKPCPQWWYQNHNERPRTDCT